jgi:hypothetical protein
MLTNMTANLNNEFEEVLPSGPPSKFLVEMSLPIYLLKAYICQIPLGVYLYSNKPQHNAKEVSIYLEVPPKACH